jgi:two-component system, cell cycle sensor histidine kinase and response regulator CckA
MYFLRRVRPRAVRLPAESASAATMDPAAQRVLIVEDNDRLRAEAVRTLSAQGYAVAEARHGEAALRVVQQSAVPFDLVVTDVTMPVMSGYKLGRSLARMRPRLPVLYLSAASESLAHFAPPVEPALFLQKPFLPEELVRRVVALLGPLVEASPSSLRGYGDALSTGVADPRVVGTVPLGSAALTGSP